CASPIPRGCPPGQATAPSLPSFTADISNHDRISESRPRFVGPRRHLHMRRFNAPLTVIVVSALTVGGSILAQQQQPPPTPPAGGQGAANGQQAGGRQGGRGRGHPIQNPPR